MGEGVVIFAFWRQQKNVTRIKGRTIFKSTFLPDAMVPSTLGAARGIPGAAGKPWHRKKYCFWGCDSVLGIAPMTATGAHDWIHRTSRSATELGIRALSHPDCIPGTFEAVGLRQPILVKCFEGFEYKISEEFMRRSFWSPSASMFLFYFVYPMTSILRPALASLGSKNELVESFSYLVNWTQPIPCYTPPVPWEPIVKREAAAFFSFSTLVFWSNHGKWVEWIMMNQY